MRPLLCGVFLASLAFAGGNDLHPDMGVIALYHQFTSEPPATVKAAMVEELDAIMGPLGMRFEWRNLNTKEIQSPTFELAVITFKGRCDVTGLSVHEFYTPGPLGWTHISDGQILPFADVDCGGIRQFLQRSLSRLPEAQRAEAFGRAAGRVLAHELYHIFADTVRHGSCGIAKEAYTVDDLLSGTFRFQDKESRELRSGKVTVVGDTPPEQR